jgi:hypothetical protein
MKKILIYIIAVAILVFVFFQIAKAAPSFTYLRTILPEANNTYDIGTSTNKFRNIYVTNASTTALGVGSDYITDITGSGLSITGGVLGITLAPFSTTNLSEGTNQYFTTARARTSISDSIIGIDYNSSTGVIGTTTGYVIPLAASTTEWSTAYTNRITSATSPITVTSNTVACPTCLTTDAYAQLQYNKTLTIRPTGVQSGNNVTLAAGSGNGSLVKVVTRQGQVLTPTTDYTISGDVITVLNADAATEVYMVQYEKSSLLDFVP